VEVPVRLRIIATLTLASILVVLMAIWILPVVGGQNSVCQHYPYTSGCR
jgi:hypothetical protein